MTRLLIRWASLSVAIWLAAYLLGGISLTGDWLTLIGVAFLFGLVNATLGTFTKVFTFPITFLSLGIWSVVVNALMLLITDNLSEALRVESFGWAFAGAIVIGLVAAIVNSVLNKVFKK